VNNANVWHSLGTEIRIHPISEFDFAVFNGSSWDSSVVNSIDASLLACLTDASPEGLREEVLLQRTAQELELELDASFVKYGQEALKQMAEVGLICKDITLEDQ